MLIKSKSVALIALASLIMSIAISGIVSAQSDWDYYSDTSSDMALFGALGAITCLVIIIVWFVIWILVAIWVYRDAEKRGKSGALWLIIVILLGLLGIIIWLVVRPPIGGEKKQAAGGRNCPNCGRPIPMDARVCPYCSKKFEE